MAFDFDKSKNLYEQAKNFVEWIAEEIIRKKNWLARLLLSDVALFVLFNPHQWPFHGLLLSLFPQLNQFAWYTPVFWSLITVIFVIAVIVAARAKRKATGHVELKLGAIKGLLPFGYEDAEIFTHLQRDQNLKECLQAIGDEHWRLGVLSGESGAGKTSFLQAGLWPEMEKRKLRCVYVKFSDLDPFESVKRACLKHLSFADGATDDADFLILLRAAAAQDRTPIVLLFDQFEQFFVHRKRKKDREPFVQALTQWFVEMQSLPVKILICIRGDFLDRLNELQKAMRYSLSPTQSFRLERFEPDQATEVFCFLAEKENLEYDRKFISEMTRQELADTEDGLISPVDIQVLARMIERQTTQNGRAFNRTTFQKLGGVEGLLERYLTIALEPLGTQSRRQSAIKVLLALTDLERNARAGALTFEDLRQKLGGDITDSELKEAIAYLLLGDVRLISPSSENEEEKFELAHERLIPALRRLAGKQLSETDRAGQLLDRRTNEWLGNGRASRYLYSWSELRLINKHRRFVTWGKERQAKEELLATSRRRFTLRYAAVGLVILLAVSGWVGWKSNAWQTYLIKRELRSYGNSLKDNDALILIAQAFTYVGDSQVALQVVGQISDDYDKAFIQKVIAEFYVEFGDKEKASALLSEAIETVNRIKTENRRADAISAIAQSIAMLEDKEKASALLSEEIKTAERLISDNTQAEAISAIAESIAKLGDKEKASTLLSEVLKIAERIGIDVYKVHALNAIAASYANSKNEDKAIPLLSEAIKTAKNLSLDIYINALSEIAETYAKLGDKDKASAVLTEAIQTAERISDTSDKAEALITIAAYLVGFGDKEKSNALLHEAINAARRSDQNQKKAVILTTIATFFAKLGNNEMASTLLSEAIKTVEMFSLIEEPLKDTALEAIAGSIAELGDKEKTNALLSETIKEAERIVFDTRQSSILAAVAASYAKIAETMKDSTLLSEAIRTAERTKFDFDKVSAFKAIASATSKISELSNDRALYDKTFRFIEGLPDDDSREKILKSILSSKLAVADVSRLRSITLNFTSEAGKAKALSRILMACSHPGLIGKEEETEDDKPVGRMWK